jgi:hypothetical protein
MVVLVEDAAQTWVSAPRRQVWTQRSTMEFILGI